MSKLKAIFIFTMNVVTLLASLLYVWVINNKKLERRLHFIETGISDARMKSFPANIIITLYKFRIKTYTI
jgi:hypothetical protein